MEKHEMIIKSGVKSLSQAERRALLLAKKKGFIYVSRTDGFMAKRREVLADLSSRGYLSLTTIGSDYLIYKELKNAA